QIIYFNFAVQMDEGTVGRLPERSGSNIAEIQKSDLYTKMGLFNFLTQEIAMDLGTANTLIIHNDEIVVNEPSIVALDRNNPKTVLAVGKRALMMHEKTHESIRTVRPLKDGVIADFNAAELMIREMIKMIYPKKPLFPPSWRMMICIPSS